MHIGCIHNSFRSVHSRCGSLCLLFFVLSSSHVCKHCCTNAFVLNRSPGCESGWSPVTDVQKSSQCPDFDVDQLFMDHFVKIFHALHDNFCELCSWSANLLGFHWHCLMAIWYNKIICCAACCGISVRNCLHAPHVNFLWPATWSQWQFACALFHAWWPATVNVWWPATWSQWQFSCALFHALHEHFCDLLWDRNGNFHARHVNLY